MKRVLAALSCLMLLNLAVGIQASADIDGDSVIDSVDLCAGTSEKDFMSSKVRENGCADVDGDQRFPGLPESHQLYDADDRNGCIPNRSNSACKTNDTDGDGYKNSEDGWKYNPCRPNKNSIACKNHKNQVNQEAIVDEGLRYINPYKALKAKKVQVSKPTKSEPNNSDLFNTQQVEVKEEVDTSDYITNAEALKVIRLFERSSNQHQAPSLQASASQLYRGMVVTDGQSDFSYYNTVVAILNILEYNDIINDRDKNYMPSDALKESMIKEEAFVQIMSKVSSFVAATRA